MSTLSVGPNGKLYGMTRLSAANNVGALFEYDPVTSSLQKIRDFEPATGGAPQNTTLLFVGDRISQSISFDSIPSKTFGDSTFNLLATASSGLPVSFTSSDTAIASVRGNLPAHAGREQPDKGRTAAKFVGFRDDVSRRDSQNPRRDGRMGDRKQQAQRRDSWAEGRARLSEGRLANAHVPRKWPLCGRARESLQVGAVWQPSDHLPPLSGSAFRARLTGLLETLRD